jgi:hypothetical protein
MAIGRCFLKNKRRVQAQNIAKMRGAGHMPEFERQTSKTEPYSAHANHSGQCLILARANRFHQSGSGLVALRA